MLTAIWQSAYSASLYRQVQTWRGKAIAYLALVLTLCWIPSLIKLQMSLSEGLARMENRVVSEFPVIRFAQGKISTPENRPYIFEFADKTGKVKIIIDTSGKYTSLEQPDVKLLLTRDRFFVRKNSGEVTMNSLSKMTAKPFTIDEAFIRKWSRVTRTWMLPIMFPFIFLFSFLKRIVQAFFVALLGMLLVSALDVELDLGALFSLAIVSMTPAMVAGTVWTVAGGAVRLSWLIFATLIVGYFVFAVNAASTRDD